MPPATGARRVAKSTASTSRRAADPQSVADELEHVGAREAALAQAEQRDRAASEAVSGQRDLLADRRAEAPLGGEACEEAELVRLE